MSIVRSLFLIGSAIFVLSACDNADNAETTAAIDSPAQKTETTTMQEPRAEKRPHELTMHGETRVDEYYWLRDDSRTDPQMLAYLEAENAYFDKVMAPTKELQDALYDEMVGRLDPDESSVPYEKDGWWYYYRYEPGNDYAIYARRKGNMEAEEEVLLDGNARADGHDFYNLGNLEMSDDHRYAAIAEDTLSRRIYEIRILDTQTGEYLPDLIGNASNSLAWSADGNYLFYLDKHPETLLAYRVMRHEVGTDAGDDVLVYEETDNRFYNGLYRSRSGDFIMLGHFETESSEYQLLAADNPLGEFKPFLPREAGHEYNIDHANGRFFIRTNWDAENFRVMSATLGTSSDKSKWTEMIAHRDDAMVLEVDAFDDWLVVGERKDGLKQVRVVALDGSVDRYLEAESDTYAMWPDKNANTDTNTLRYGYTSMTTPEQIWEIDLSTGETQLLKTTRVLGEFYSGNYLDKRMKITARDGTEVPVSLVYHKDTPLDGTAPALIYAYGSYGYSTDPVFRNSVVSILDRGFIFALAHIRGGQEMGRRWYEDGRLMNKKNTFTDFVDVTGALQKQKLIDPKRTYARGGSAGGLLMGAVINMAPELYHGVVAAVPFVDVITTMSDETIPLTTGEWNEWGNPIKDKEAYDYMLSYSPYDQVTNQDYPNLLITAGLHDSQVQYFEPAKWVARLRDRRTDDNKLLLYTNMEAGHGGASGRYSAYKEVAQDYAFLVDLAGVEN